MESFQVGEEFTATSAEQHRQLEALEAFETFLAHCQSEDRQFLSGLQVRLYHPDVACLDMADAQGTHAASMQVCAALNVSSQPNSLCSSSCTAA